jgi:hypothetical protein
LNCDTIPFVNPAPKLLSASVFPLVLLVLIGATLSGCGGGPDRDVAVTLYNGGQGVPLYVANDAKLLTGAPKDFQRYMAHAVRSAIESDDGTCNEPAVYLVTAIANTGHAAGELSHCGVRRIFWARKSGEWIKIWSGTGVPPCADLKRNKVPNGLTGTRCTADGSTHVYTG